MKEKDIFKAEELETIDNQMFGAFDPEDESWIVGGSRITNTAIYTYSPNGSDAMLDLDFWELDTQESPTSRS